MAVIIAIEAFIKKRHPKIATEIIVAAKILSKGVRTPPITIFVFVIIPFITTLLLRMM